MTSRTLLTAALAVLVPMVASAQPTAPYAGQDAREIKSLSADEIAGYLNGEGLGLAKAGELNHYPGPKHVLAMASELGLSDAQRARIDDIARAMSAAAVPVGREIVEAERDLDRSFAAGTIDAPSLHAATARIAALQGRLRETHLAAHLATRAVLTPAQVATYDRLRGYGTPDGTMQHHHPGS